MCPCDHPRALTQGTSQQSISGSWAAKPPQAGRCLTCPGHLCLSPPCSAVLLQGWISCSAWGNCLDTSLCGWAFFPAFKNYFIHTSESDFNVTTSGGKLVAKPGREPTPTFPTLHPSYHKGRRNREISPFCVSQLTGIFCETSRRLLGEFFISDAVIPQRLWIFFSSKYSYIRYNFIILSLNS